ncbi:MAG: hypothetical protein AB1705_26940 [Verrucomicrobiota bacterium]
MPRPLPPDPPLVWEGESQALLDRATLALGRLDGLTSVLPDAAIFLYACVGSRRWNG